MTSVRAFARPALATVLVAGLATLASGCAASPGSAPPAPTAPTTSTTGDPEDTACRAEYDRSVSALMRSQPRPPDLQDRVDQAVARFIAEHPECPAAAARVAAGR
jgi:ABC-type glycerol-3-phosphate transport system substrate-binding protein